MYPLNTRGMSWFYFIIFFFFRDLFHPKSDKTFSIQQFLKIRLLFMKMLFIGWIKGSMVNILFGVLVFLLPKPCIAKHYNVPINIINTQVDLFK